MSVLSDAEIAIARPESGRSAASRWNGVVIRTPLEQVRALGRATMGVKVMAVGETKIASIATFTPTRPAQTQLDLPR